MISPKHRLRFRQACLAVTVFMICPKIKHMFEELRPFDWVMLVVEVLVLGVIVWEYVEHKLHEQKTKGRLASVFAFMHKGQELQASVPPSVNADETAVPPWAEAVEKWATDTNDFLLTGSAQAPATFLHHVGEPTVHFQGVLWSAHTHYAFLMARLKNLRAVMEKPDVYL